MPNMTQEQVNAFNARQSRKLPIDFGRLEGDSPRESVLHEQIFAECRRRGWIALHGAMSERTHRTLGEPDFVILRDACRVLFVECKAAKGKLSPDQLGMQAHARKLGHEIHVVRSLKEFLAIL